MSFNKVNNFVEIHNLVTIADYLLIDCLKKANIENLLEKIKKHLLRSKGQVKIIDIKKLAFKFFNF